MRLDQEKNRRNSVLELIAGRAQVLDTFRSGIFVSTLNEMKRKSKVCYEQAESQYPSNILDSEVKLAPPKLTLLNQGERIEILATKQILYRLLIALAQVKAGNTSKNLLNEIHQIIFSLYQLKKTTKRRMII